MTNQRAPSWLVRTKGAAAGHDHQGEGAQVPENRRDWRRGFGLRPFSAVEGAISRARQARALKKITKAMTDDENEIPRGPMPGWWCGAAGSRAVTRMRQERGGHPSLLASSVTIPGEDHGYASRRIGRPTYSYSGSESSRGWLVSRHPFVTNLFVHSKCVERRLVGFKTVIGRPTYSAIVCGSSRVGWSRYHHRPASLVWVCDSPEGR